MQIEEAPAHGGRSFGRSAFQFSWGKITSHTAFPSSRFLASCGSSRVCASESLDLRLVGWPRSSPPSGGAAPLPKPRLLGKACAPGHQLTQARVAEIQRSPDEHAHVNAEQNMSKHG